MDFETPEEGYLAKIFVAAGEKDVRVGKVSIHIWSICVNIFLLKCVYRYIFWSYANKINI